jgi:hypothetical protein
LVLLFKPENGGDRYLQIIQNISSLSANYIPIYPTRWNSSCPKYFYKKQRELARLITDKLFN